MSLFSRLQAAAAFLRLKVSSAEQTDFVTPETGLILSRPEKSPHAWSGKNEFSRPEGPDTAGCDTLFAVQELTRVLSSGPDTSDATDISLALGNLFRAQGDIDRAVKLREAVLSRSGLETAFKARTFFELGLDYKRAGLLDRSLMALKEAKRLGLAEMPINRELAHIHADSGNFAAAAETFAALGNRPAEAHFLVRRAEETAAAGNDGNALALVKHAIEVYPGSPEAWVALTSMSLLVRDTAKVAATLTKGLAATDASGRLLLLEGLYSLCEKTFTSGFGQAALAEVTNALTGVLAEQKPDLLNYYYGGLFLQHAGLREEAEQWFTKALVLQPDFWATRLALLELSAEKEQLSPVLAGQIDFFTKQGAAAKRFICSPCGMRRDRIFSLCPRCHAWHSVAFRTNLT